MHGLFIFGYGKSEAFYRVATFRCLYPNRRAHGDIHIYHKKILHLYFLHDIGIPRSVLFHFCFLDQFEALHPGGKKESLALQLDHRFSYSEQLFKQIFQQIKMQHVCTIAERFGRFRVGFYEKSISSCSYCSLGDGSYHGWIASGNA